MGCATTAKFLAICQSAVRLYIESVEDLAKRDASLEEHLIAWKRSERYRQQSASALIALQSHIDQHGCGGIEKFELAESAQISN